MKNNSINITKETIQKSYIMASLKTFVALSKHSLSGVSVQPCTLSRAKNVPNILQLPWKPYKYETRSVLSKPKYYSSITEQHSPCAASSSANCLLLLTKIKVHQSLLLSFKR